MTTSRYPVRILLVALLLLIGACTMLRAGYNHFDSAASWMVNDYFDFNPDQRDQFTQRFERLHSWHRQTQLPEYTQFLGDIQTRARRGMRDADVLWVIDGFKQRYQRITARGASDTADLLATLTPEQIEHLRKQIDKDNKKFIRENHVDGSEAERRKEVQQRTLKQLREWVGPLDDAQLTKVNALLQTLPPIEKLRYEDRLRRQREFLALLELRNGERAVFAQRLRDWLENWESGRSAEQAKLFEESWKKRAAFYSAIDQMLTPAQRNHLVAKLQDYINDFRELSANKRA